MPFAAPLNWPMTLMWATWALILLMTLVWWMQLPSMPRLTSSLSMTSHLWNW